MLNYFQAIIFGLVQGITELFPISSLGHSVILPSLFGWHINQTDPFFLTFLVATHFATAIVLFLFFWKDWKRIIAALFRSLAEKEIKDPDARLAWLLIVSTIPAGILGMLLQDYMQTLFASPRLVAAVLILNGFLLYTAEQINKRNSARQRSETGSDTRIAALTWSQAVKIGILQALALIPGFSRTGASLTGGLLMGLSHEDAARFAFLLATPIIAAASLLKLPDLFTTNEPGVVGPTIVGAIVAGIGAYFSVKFLTKYFETKNLVPFAIYCVVFGGLVSVYLFIR